MPLQNEAVSGVLFRIWSTILQIVYLLQMVISTANQVSQSSFSFPHYHKLPPPLPRISPSFPWATSFWVSEFHLCYPKIIEVSLVAPKNLQTSIRAERDGGISTMTMQRFFTLKKIGGKLLGHQLRPRDVSCFENLFYYHLSTVTEQRWRCSCDRTKFQG